MKYGSIMLLGGAMLFAVAVHAQGKSVFVLPLMKATVAPQAQVLWDIGNNALDDDGNPSAKKMTAADWAKLGKAAQAVKAAAQAMSVEGGVAVAPAGTKLQDEGAPGNATAKQIQAFIDANPKDFAAHSRALADVSDTFIKAAAGKDPVLLGDASGKLDEVCEACHVKYWYPK